LPYGPSLFHVSALRASITAKGKRMRTETRTVRIGEDVGPIDWSHPTAKDMPAIWREAEEAPQDFEFGDYRRSILRICMYDGWPY
jgi:hypothetical protein